MLRFLRVAFIIILSTVILFVIGVWFQTAVPKKRCFETMIKEKKDSNRKEYQALCENLKQIVSIKPEHMNELKKLFIASREADNKIGLWIQRSIPGESVETMEVVHSMICQARESCFLRQREIIELEEQYAEFLKKNPMLKYIL